jgi:acyl-ACP thioesterase
MNNAVYGKTIENVLKRQDMKFCSERKKALKYVKKINFNREIIFTKNLAALHMNRMQVKYNKPIYVGFWVALAFSW